MRSFRILIGLAAIMGADGVILAALSAHQADAARLGAASSMLLFHATAVLASAALAERGMVHIRIGIAASFGFVVASALFAGDLTLRQRSGARWRGLFLPSPVVEKVARTQSATDEGSLSVEATPHPPSMLRISRTLSHKARGKNKRHFAPWPPIR
ncbi:MAG: hypothetical protein E6G93_17995 [Alphaproteobacteria bacterium]|nr:MAG: hypothetical protein E6G93_17995 [Alphaproteobacteria bacterium]